jgi:ArsR family transcriptional regulator
LAAQLENLELHQGELADLQPALPPVDFLLIGMVLHHLPEPAGFFQQAARTLADGGALLVIELARHEQHWAGPQCGDLWLGFDADELNQWASAAGLHPVYQRFAGLRTGFQIQTLAWKKGKNHE